MIKMLKCENQKFTLKIGRNDFPELFVFDGEYGKNCLMTGSVNRCVAVLSSWLIDSMAQMKKEGRDLLEIEFNYNDKLGSKLTTGQREEVQTHLFDDEP